MKDLLKHKISLEDRFLAVLVIMDGRRKVPLTELVEEYGLKVGQTNRSAARMYHNGLNANSGFDHFEASELMLTLAGAVLPKEKEEDVPEETSVYASAGDLADDLDDLIRIAVGDEGGEGPEGDLGAGEGDGDAGPVGPGAEAPVEPVRKRGRGRPRTR